LCNLWRSLHCWEIKSDTLVWCTRHLIICLLLTFACCSPFISCPSLLGFPPPNLHTLFPCLSTLANSLPASWMTFASLLLF
jgi:hypothetical protein